MKITLNPQKCIGCGACVSICAQHFEIKEDGKSHLINAESAALDKEMKTVNEPDCAKDAAENCPVQAINAQ